MIVIILNILIIIISLLTSSEEEFLTSVNPPLNSTFSITNTNITKTTNLFSNITINETKTSNFTNTKTLIETSTFKQNTKTLKCLIGVKTSGINYINSTPIEPSSCEDNVEYEKRKCLSIVCSNTDSYGSFIWKSCGTCAGLRDVWGMSESFYKHSCKCSECDNKDLCNSSIWNFKQISIFYLVKIILPLLLTFLII